MATYKQRTPITRNTHHKEDETVEYHHKQQQHHHASNTGTLTTSAPLYINNTITSGHQSSIHIGFSVAPSQNDNISSITVSSEQEWAPLGDLLVDRESLHRQPLHQQHHKHVQDNEVQEWQVILNPPSRRRLFLQKRQQQLEQQRQQKPVSITLNTSNGKKNDIISEISTMTPGDISTTMNDEEFSTSKSRSDSELESPLVTKPRQESDHQNNSEDDVDCQQEASLSLDSANLRSTPGKESETITSAHAFTVADLTPVPLIVQSEDTSSSFDLAFSDDLISNYPEDQSIWSLDEDTDIYSSYSISTPPTTFHRQQFPSSPSEASLGEGLITTPHSSSTSLSHLLFHPTLSQHQQSQQSLGREWSRFQTYQSQMPYHDGLGNFLLSPSHSSFPRLSNTTGTVSTSESGSDLELESSRHSLLYVYQRRQQQQHHQILDVQSPDCQNYNHNLRVVSKRLTKMTRKKRQMVHFDTDAASSTRSTSPMPFVRRLHQNKHIPSRLREGIDMNDDSETEDLQAIEDANALVVDILTPTGWLQVFEKALNTFRASFENELDPSDSDSIHPIRAWASSQEEPIEIPLGPRKHCYAITSPSIRAESYKHVSDQLTAATTPIQHSPRFGIEHNMAQVKYQMSVLTLDTLKQLQTQRDHTYRYSCSHKYYHRRWPSISEIQEEYDSFDEMNTASTSTTTSLLEAALSALRRFRNHVKTNLMDPGLDNELISDLSRLGFAGDLGMEVTEGVAKDG